MMNLYIFEPYKWPYCGGAIVVLHWSLQQAIELIHKQHPNEKDPICETPKEIETVKIRYGDGSENVQGYGWLLSEVLQVSQTETPRIVAFNYQYA